jgi:inner membrane protein
MDSLTQFVLGAAVSTACLGKTLGPRKAALIGGVLGTLPDLDVFLPFDTPVDSFVFHRGWTHALAVHVLATPLIGEALVRMFSALRERRALVWCTVFLCLTTHAVIDAMTVYGTRLFWPFYPDPVGVGSVFIIDPIYSLPLVVVVIWALAKRHWSARLGWGVTLALVFSSAYMALSVGVQAHVTQRAKAILAEAGIEPERIFAIAAPLNTVLWKVMALEEGRYHNLYLSLLDGDKAPEIYTHSRRADLIACLGENPAFEKLAWFSRGYYRAEREGDKILISDLRMGLTPNYVFRFAVAEITESGVQEIEPLRAAGQRRTAEGDFAWLLDRIAGRPAVRAVEAKGPASAGAAGESAPC